MVAPGPVPGTIGWLGRLVRAAEGIVTGRRGDARAGAVVASSKSRRRRCSGAGLTAAYRRAPFHRPRATRPASTHEREDAAEPVDRRQPVGERHVVLDVGTTTIRFGASAVRTLGAVHLPVREVRRPSPRPALPISETWKEILSTACRTLRHGRRDRGAAGRLREVGGVHALPSPSDRSASTARRATCRSATTARSEHSHAPSSGSCAPATGGVDPKHDDVVPVVRRWRRRARERRPCTSVASRRPRTRVPPLRVDAVVVGDRLDEPQIPVRIGLGLGSPASTPCSSGRRASARCFTPRSKSSSEPYTRPRTGFDGCAASSLTVRKWIRRRARRLEVEALHRTDAAVGPVRQQLERERRAVVVDRVRPIGHRRRFPERAARPGACPIVFQMSSYSGHAAFFS